MRQILAHQLIEPGPGRLELLFEQLVHPVLLRRGREVGARHPLGQIHDLRREARRPADVVLPPTADLELVQRFLGRDELLFERVRLNPDVTRALVGEERAQ